MSDETATELDSELDEKDRELADALLQHKSRKSPLLFVLKIFIGVIVLIFISVGILFVVGGSEMKLVVSESIDARSERVYKLLTDSEHVKKWVSGISSIENVGDVESHGVGAKSKITIDNNGTPFIIHDEVTVAKENEEMELAMTSDMFEIVNHFQLAESTTEGSVPHTTIEQTYSVKFKGLVRIFAPFLKSSIESQLKGDLERLKKLAESDYAK